MPINLKYENFQPIHSYNSNIFINNTLSLNANTIIETTNNGFYHISVKSGDSGNSPIFNPKLLRKRK